MNTIWFLAIPLFAWADRRIGKGGPGARSSAFLAVLLSAIVVAFVTRQYAGAILMAVWLVYRTLPWSYWGTLTPRTLEQYVGSMVRHLIPAIAAVLLWRLTNLTDDLAVMCFVVFGVLATGLSVMYAESVDKIAEDVDVPIEVRNKEQAKLNGKFEVLRGGMYGLALFVSQAVL